MIAYVLDTDHASILRRHESPEYARLKVNLETLQPEDVGVSVASFHEQSMGCNKLINSAKSSDKLIRGYELLFNVIDDYRKFPLLPFDAAALAIFDKLKAAKTRISTPDLRIAAIALAHDLTLVTRNKSDFEKVPNLRIEDWTR